MWRKTYLIIWIITIISGSIYLMHFNQNPGSTYPAPSLWPGEFFLSYSSTYPTLVLLLHPKCSCSKATLVELDKIVSRFPNQLEIYAFLFYPSKKNKEWIAGDIYEKITSMPEVSMYPDRDGKLSRVFGGATSGHVVLYSTEGKLVFSGGITPSRGHSGDSKGNELIARYLSGKSINQDSTFTFGCSLGLSYD